MIKELLKALEEVKASAENLKSVYEKMVIDRHQNGCYAEAGFYVDRILDLDDVIEKFDRSINNLKRGS